MRLKRAVEMLTKRVAWLEIKVQEHPDHHYLRAEYAATAMGRDALQEKLDAIHATEYINV